MVHELAGLAESVPAPVRSAVADASRVVWADPGAAANRLRVACEELLTACEVRRTQLVNGREKPVPTDARIRQLQQRNAEAAEALEAVKWIGNSGSHTADLTIADVLEGAEMFEHAAELLFDKSRALLKRRIRAVNESKGVPAKRRAGTE